MSGADRSAQCVAVSNWLSPDDTDCKVTAWKVSEGAERHPELAGRMSLDLDFGPASVHLRPTRAEAFQLITMLEWALDLGVFALTNSPAAAPDAPASTAAEVTS